MHLLIKILFSIGIILTATALGRKMPSTAGLISVMPLTGALVLIWIFVENNGNPRIMQNFAKGALWGILPSILFFFIAFFCFKKQLPLSIVLLASFGTWFIAALIHQWILK